MTSVESVLFNRNQFIKAIFENGLRTGNTREVFKTKQAINDDFFTYCREHNHLSSYHSVSQSINQSTTSENRERIINEIISRDLSPEQASHFYQHFTFKTIRAGVVNTETYHQDMEWFIDNDIIDLASGAFKSGKGASGETAKRRVRTQGAYQKIITNLSDTEKKTFLDKLEQLEDNIQTAKDKAMERRIQEATLIRRLERAQQAND